MSTQSILNDVRLALRITSNALDTELAALIDSAKRDLSIAGIQSPDLASDVDVSDPLIRRAIILYCKADQNVDQAAERYMSVYEHLKSALCLSDEYN